MNEAAPQMHYWIVEGREAWRSADPHGLGAELWVPARAAWVPHPGDFGFWTHRRPATESEVRAIVGRPTATP